MDSDLPLQAEPLADHIGGLVEHLGEVSSALFLNQNGRDDDPQILQAERASTRFSMAVSQFKAIVLFVEADAELASR